MNISLCIISPCIVHPDRAVKGDFFKQGPKWWTWCPARFAVPACKYCFKQKLQEVSMKNHEKPPPGCFLQNEGLVDIYIYLYVNTYTYPSTKGIHHVGYKFFSLLNLAQCHHVHSHFEPIHWEVGFFRPGRLTKRIYIPGSLYPIIYRNPH